VKLLHTSDWHVGKTLRGNSRVDEHRAVLAEVRAVAEAEEVDLVLVAGDLFDTAAPSPESQELVYQTLLGFARAGVEVAVIGGNHDNARALRAVAPVFAGCGVRVVSEPARPSDGGTFSFVARDGTPVNVSMLPFVSQRGIVKADQLMSGEAFDHALLYAQRLGALIAAMCAPFTADAANVLMAHAFVLGGATGGGERAAHLVEEYAVQAPAFPATAGYVALGHLHRAQSLAGATALHYCGSPLQLDFGESAQAKQVNVVELVPGLPAKVRAHTLAAGRALRTYQGTFDQLREAVADDDAWLRLVLREPHTATLGQQVRDTFGERVVEVRVEAPHQPGAEPAPSRQGRTPHELFAEYLASRNRTDAQVAALFASLLDAELSGEGEVLA
jgi:exonuclease SbcD